MNTIFKSTDNIAKNEESKLTPEEIIDQKVLKLKSSAVLLGAILVILCIAFAAVTLYDSKVEVKYFEKNYPDQVENFKNGDISIEVPQDFVDLTKKNGEIAGFIEGLFAKLTMLSAVTLLILALSVAGFVPAKTKIMYVGVFSVGIIACPTIIGLFDPFREIMNYLSSPHFAVLQFIIVLLIDLAIEYIKKTGKNNVNYQ